MTQQHPVSPSNRLVAQWYSEALKARPNATELTRIIAASAAQWGADEELEACRTQIIDGIGRVYIEGDRNRVLLAEDIWTARRPKPPSLKEQSVALIDRIQASKEAWDISELDIIRQALEQLPDNK